MPCKIISCYSHWEAKTALTMVRRKYDRKGRQRSHAEVLPERALEAEADDGVMRAIFLNKPTEYCRRRTQTTKSGVQALPLVLLLNL